MPVVPFYFYFAFVGARELVAILAARRQSRSFLPIHYLPFVLLALWFGGLTVHEWQVARDPLTVAEGLDMPDSIELLEHIDRNLPADATLIFWKPRALTLYSQRRAILQVNAQQITDSPADYLIIYKYEKLGNVNARMSRASAEKPESSS